MQPYELWRDTGQHNLECGPCDDLKKSYGCIRPTGIVQNYGIGMSLYFKFTKTLLVLFFFCALAAVVPMTYYWTTRFEVELNCLITTVVAAYTFHYSISCTSFHFFLFFFAKLLSLFFFFPPIFLLSLS